MKPAKIFYSEKYVQAADEFDTTRKAGWIADSLRKAPLDNVLVTEPEPVTEDDLRSIHALEYVRAVRTGDPPELARSHNLAWDPGLWGAVCASTGGIVAAAQAALNDGVAGTLSSGLHHARRAHGEGLCTFNGLALAALVAHVATSGRVLIVDLDAHCGGGTHDILGGSPWARMLDVSVSRFDAYRPAPQNTLDMVYDSASYLETVERRLAECGGGYALCLYNAGMDPHEHCRIGGLRGITADMLRKREELVFGWCESAGIPVAFALAGGYVSPSLDEAALVNLHRMTIETAALCRTP